jgi:hypothetical protein
MPTGQRTAAESVDERDRSLRQNAASAPFLAVAGVGPNCSNAGGSKFTALQDHATVSTNKASQHPSLGLCSEHVFTGYAQHLIVKLLAQEERRFEKLVEFASNGRHVARPLGFEQEGKRADHLQPGLLGYPSSGALVNENRIGTDFDGQRERFALTVTKPPSGRDYRRLAGWRLHQDPMGKDWNGRQDLASDSRRNQNGPENGWNEIEALNSRKGDQRAGV